MQHFKKNPDYNNPAFNTKYGVYSERCGLNNVLMSWGHDDYMYLVCLQTSIYVSTYLFIDHYNKIFNWPIWHVQVAKENNTTLPSAALFIIRYHSFYGKLLNREILWISPRKKDPIFLINWLWLNFGMILQLYTRQEPTSTWWMKRMSKTWSGFMYSSKSLYLSLHIEFLLLDFFSISQLVYVLNRIFIVSM